MQMLIFVKIKANFFQLKIFLMYLIFPLMEIYQKKIKFKIKTL